MNGTVTYHPKTQRWFIDAPPHIVIRLKRVFGKLSKKHHGRLSLSDTEENMRDLEWFLARYPMEVSDPRRLQARSSAHKERESLIERMLAKRADLPPFELALPAREYQRQAAALALATRGLLLADDLGLGKTVSGICMFTDSRTLPALVVTLTHLPMQWEREINRFAPHLRTHVLKSAKPYDLTLHRKEDGTQLALPSSLPDVIITSYSKLHGWAEALAPIIEGRLIVWDEVQELRNDQKTKNDSGKREYTQKYAAGLHLAKHAGFRLGLSATPIHNYGGEFFAVFQCLRPDELGTKAEFLEEWCKAVEDNKPKISDPAAFGTYTRSAGLMLRRTVKDVGRELPPVTKVMHPIEANAKALDAVSAQCADLAKIILKQGEAERGEKLLASEQFSNRLRQATGIAKAPFAADFVRLLVESGEKVLLYGWHREVYSIWLEKLKDLNPVMYTGSESPREKDESKTRFVSGDSKVMIMSLRAGAGLDGLQRACRTAVFGELDWSPAVHEQNIGRVARDEQKDLVLAYFLLADCGSDPIVIDVLGLKKQQLVGVRDPNADIVERLEVDGDRIKRLAADYLKQRGLAMPREETAA